MAEVSPVNPSSAAPAKKETSTPAVSKSTHLQIARFAFVHTLLTENRTRIKETKKRLQAIVDAEDELILIDDEETIPCQIHESAFVHRSKVEAEAYLEANKTRLEAELREFEIGSAELEHEIGELRTQLYGQLGNAVQLDTSGFDDNDD